MTERIDFIFKDETIYLSQSAGFFSCCSVRLDAIIQYYNRFGKLPRVVDSQQQFRLYKLRDHPDADVSRDFFRAPETVDVEMPPAPVSYKENYQGRDYHTIDFAPILPFVKKYFSPTDEILETAAFLEKKYGLDYNNTCVLFYRGLDKATEFPIAPYKDVFQRARKIARENPGVRFLVQSDEADFIHAALREFPEAVVFRDETRAVARQITSVDLVYRDSGENYYYSKLFFAIVLVMSRARHFICNTGNISIWTCFYRGSADATVHQYLNYKFI